MAGRGRLIGGVAASALILVLAGAPPLVQGADHLDAPGLTPPSGRFDADINDLYVFEGENPNRTVLVMTTHPAAGVFSPTRYATDVLYRFHIDRNGDARADLAFQWRFRDTKDGGQQYRVRRFRGENAREFENGVLWAKGRVGTIRQTRANGMVWAGLRSDPFFFDLDAFLGVVGGVANGRTFCDGPGGTGVDFFEPLNVNAIVMEMRDQHLGSNIGVWATTTARGGDDDDDDDDDDDNGDDDNGDDDNGNGRFDRMGRPAINTVFNAGDDKNAFNNGRPRTDLARFGANVEGVLAAFSALDSEGAYSSGETATLASVLLPDVVTYDTSTPAVGPLNGRGLADDVIDAELNIVTGGFPFPGRDGMGAIGTDCVGPHTDLLSGFPYLGAPN